MTDLRTTEEVTRSPIDGSELIRLATTGTNWKASLSSVFSSLGGGSGSGGISPRDFGALGDGSVHKITASDIAANTQWIGTYDVGTEWDVVGLQEAIYNCFASASSARPANYVNVIAPYNLLRNAPSSSLVDGSITAAGVHFEGRNTAGAYIRFGFTSAIIVTEAKWYQDVSTSHGTWQWQGNDTLGSLGEPDPATWANIGSTFTLGGSTIQTQTTLNANATAYSFYRLLGVSGTISNTPYLEQIEFKVGGSYVTGNRAASIVWNASNGTYRLNKTLFIPNGSYLINRSVLAVAQGFSITGEARQGAILHWTGAPDVIMFMTDALAYGRVINLSLEAWAINDVGLFSLDGVGLYGGLKPQQLIFDNLLIFGGSLVQNGCYVARSGDNAQGSEIIWNNVYMSGCLDSAFAAGGSNSLGHTFIGGDFQGNPKNSIVIYGGSATILGTHFENQNADFAFSSPQASQPLTEGADVYVYPGGGAGSITLLSGIRSESEVLCLGGSNRLSKLDSCSVLGAGITGYFTSYPYQLGVIIKPSTNNTRKRNFVVVDQGGTQTWNSMTPGASTTVFTDSGSPGYTTNQWAGYTFFFRYGSNGFTTHGPIASNTANTITVSEATGPASLSSLYIIGGKTHASVTPNFDSVSNTTLVVTGSGSQGVVTTAGSDTITLSSGFGTPSVGQFIVIPNGFGMQPSTSVPAVKTALIAKIITDLGSDNWQINKPATYSISYGTAYLGTGLVDNNITWMHLPFASVSGARSMMDCTIQSGNIATVDVASFSVNSAGTDWVSGRSDNSGKVAHLTNNTVYHLLDYNNLDTSATVDLTDPFARLNVIRLTPTQSMTLNAPTVSSGQALSYYSQEVTFIITTSGTTSRTITFGSNFKSTGTLATGTVSDKVFVIKFISDGSNYNEVSRTTAM